MNIKLIICCFAYLLLLSCSKTNKSDNQQALEIAICTPNQQIDKVDFGNIPTVIPNDLTITAGKNSKGTTQLNLIAGPAVWQPKKENGAKVKVFAFSEKEGNPQIPGPFLRVKQGTRIKITVENCIAPEQPIGIPSGNRIVDGMKFTTQNVLVIHDLLRAANDNSEIHIAYGETREIEFTASQVGRFIYWGSTSDQSMFSRTGLDSQLTGLIVVDPVDEELFPGERLLMITMIDVFADTVDATSGFDAFELAINGLSWPHTERMVYPVNTTQRWHWFNGSGYEHPMHLHGFHFRTLARENGRHLYLPVKDEVQEVVTELVEPGGSFLMEWTPTRIGNWLMHCHIIDHVVPDPPRSAEERDHDHDDIHEHAIKAMGGLVLGITITDQEDLEVDEVPAHQLYLVARQKPTIEGQTPVRGFALEQKSLGAKGPFSSPGPPILLTRGEMTRITVINHTDQSTVVHWHGMELKSYYDGVPGWSGYQDDVAPMIAVGKSFDAYIKPPRAGTFIYHTHMDETDQLRSGLYGPLLVMEKGEEYDPETDKIILIGDVVDHETGKSLGVTINGSNHPAPMQFKLGQSYRLRFINIGEAPTVNIEVKSDGELLTWKAHAKDGATLPVKLQKEVPAKLRMSSGETYDFYFTAENPANAEIVVDWPYPTMAGHKVIRQPLRVI